MKAFDLSRVQKSGARFDPDKNVWFNHQHLQLKPLGELVRLFREELAELGIPQEDYSDGHLASIVSLIRERASFIHEFWDLGSYFFQAPLSFDEKAVRKQWKSGTAERISALADVLEAAESFTAQASESVVKTWITDNALGFGQVMPPLRLSIVGALKGPQLFEIMELIGQEETVSRMRFAVANIDAKP